MSAPFRRIDPEVGSTSRRMVCAVEVLPHPDSPTRATISPFRRVKETPSTARTTCRGWRETVPTSPRRTGYWVWRSVTSRSGGPESGAGASPVAVAALDPTLASRSSFGIRSVRLIRSGSRSTTPRR